MMATGPAKKAEARRLTAYENDIGPFHILLAVLIHTYAEFVYFSNRSEDKDDMDVTLMPGANQMRAFLLKQISRQDGIFQPSYHEFFTSIKEGLDRAWKLKCTSRLQEFFESLQSPDDLLAFEASTLRPATLQFISDPSEDVIPIHPQTEFGLFFRAVSLAFMLLPYEAICGLYIDLRKYFQNSRANAQADEVRLLERRVCVEAFLESKIKEIAVKGSSEEHLKELTQLADYLDRKLPVRQTQMLWHKIAMQYADHESAVTALHHYFDSPSGCQVETSESRSTPFQAALLSLGSCHTSFGQTEEALIALNECARVAQQVNDDVCLQHNVAELCRLQAETSSSGQQHQGAPEGEHALENLNQLHRLLRRCQKRSQELNLPHLTAYASTALSQFRWRHKLTRQKTEAHADSGAETVEGNSMMHNLGYVQELYYNTKLACAIPRAEHCTDQMGQKIPTVEVFDLYNTVKGNLHSSLAGMMDEVAEATEQSVGSALLTQGAFHFQRGQRAMAESYVKSFLSSYSETASHEDKCLAVAQLATSRSHTHGPDAALQYLEKVEGCGWNLTSKKFLVAKLSIMHAKALNEGRLDLADQLAREIINTAGPVMTLNADLRAEGGRCQVENLIRRKTFDRAEDLALELFAQYRDTNLHGQSLQMLLLLARLHIQSDSLSAALPYAESAVKLAEALRFDLLAAEAKILAEQCCSALALKDKDACLRAVLSLMPLINQSGCLQIRALLHWTIVSLHLRQAKLEPSSKHRTMLHLDEAEKLYDQIGNLEMLDQCKETAKLLKAHFEGLAKQDELHTMKCSTQLDSTRMLTSKA